MAKKEDFTEQEWEALQKGVTGAGLLVSVSDRGFFDTFKEAGALGKHVGQAKQSSDSELVRELANVRGTGFGVTARPEEVERETLASLADREGDAGGEGSGRAGAVPAVRPRDRPVGRGRRRRRRDRRGRRDPEDRSGSSLSLLDSSFPNRRSTKLAMSGDSPRHG